MILLGFNLLLPILALLASLLSNRPLSKLASVRKFKGDSKHLSRSVQLVHEDLGLESTYKLPAEVELQKRSNKLVQKFVITIASLLLIINNVAILLLPPLPALELITILDGYKIGLVADKLTTIYVLMISILYFFTNLYSFFYLQLQNHSELNQDINTRIHFFFMPIAIMASIGIAYSINLLSLFVFYELLTLSTYPLVVQSFSDHARKAGRTYIITLLSSSLVFIFFALIFLDQNYDMAGNSIFNKNGVFTNLAEKDAIILLVCFIFGFSKTAIFPLYKWLPKAMVAPIPVSALLHAVAVVKSGIFALIKVFVYLFGLDYLNNLHHIIPWSLDWITLLGCFTIIYAGIMACKQESMKKILAYSTISQLSYMIVFLSLASTATFTLSYLQILSHSIAKITLFFAVGIIYISTKKSDVNEMQGMFRILPIPVILFILGSFSIIGLPPSIGWLVKNLVSYTITCDTWVNSVIVTTLIISPLLGCYYFFKPIYKMLSPLSQNDVPHTIYYPSKYLSLVTMFTYSMAILLFVYFDEIIKTINSFL